MEKEWTVLRYVGKNHYLKRPCAQETVLLREYVTFPDIFADVTR